MFLNRAAVALLVLCSCCSPDSEKSKVVQQNKDNLADSVNHDAALVVDILDTSYGLLNVAHMGKERLPDTLHRKKVEEFIQRQTSAMIRLKTFAESKGIAIPFAGPEKRNKAVKKLEDESNSRFDEQWLKEVKRLHSKLGKDIESYRKDAKDSSLVQVLDSALMILKDNNTILSDIETEYNQRSI